MSLAVSAIFSSIDLSLRMTSLRSWLALPG
jgi:hypothetical protein